MSLTEGTEKKTATLNPCDRVNILGRIGKSYYYVNLLGKAGKTIRTGLVEQKQVLLYSGTETRDYVAKMRKGSWKYMYYSNKEGRIKYDHSPIQMVLVENTVHIYVNFCYKGPAVNKKFTCTDEEGSTTKSDFTYKQVFEQGIKKYWGDEGSHIFKGGEHRYQRRYDIPGSKEKAVYEYCEKDFEKGVTLSCEVHFIRKQLTGDKQIPVYIGEEKKSDGSYWFWVHSEEKDIKKKEKGSIYQYPTYHFDDKGRYVNIPTNPQLSSNTAKGRSDEFTLTEYQQTCAHEFGHVLGLDDAYRDTIDKGYGEKELVRIDDFFFEKYYPKACIMLKERTKDFKMITANDLEMVLLAYNNAQNPDKKRNSWQSYREYQYQIESKTYKRFLRSKAITWKGERVK